MNSPINIGIGKPSLSSVRLPAPGKLAKYFIVRRLSAYKLFTNLVYDLLLTIIEVIMSFRVVLSSAGYLPATDHRLRRRSRVGSTMMCDS